MLTAAPNKLLLVFCGCTPNFKFLTQAPFFQMLGGAVAGLPTSAAAAASAAAVAVAAHKQFHPNSPPLDLDSWKEAFLQQANNNTNGNPNKNVRTINVLKFRYCEKTTKI